MSAGLTSLNSAVAGNSGATPDLSQRNEYDQLKGEFLASLNHELRTPLSGVIGMADLLAETPMSEEQGDYLESLRGCARELLDSLNSILDYSAWTAGKFRLEASEFALEPVLEALRAETVTAVRGKNLEVTTEWDPQLPETVIADEVHFRQLLGHLLRNAAKFTTEGEIRFSAKVETEVLGWPGAAQTDSDRRWVRFAVADTGIGIPANKLEVIFDSFRQLDGGLARMYRGLGLGLTLARTIAIGMGGYISVRSGVGEGSGPRGSVFEVLLPLQVSTAAAEPAPFSESETVRRVLVVDDNRIAQAVVSHALKKGRYAVQLAESGERALTLAATGSFDLVLMDLQMPGMDGFTTCREMRRIAGYENVPILALTANFSDEQRRACAQSGMQGYLAKPVQRAELLIAVSRHLAQASPAEAPPAEADGRETTEGE
ncbi:MAG: response regulator [Bryobacteraceae bacterium]